MKKRIKINAIDLQPGDYHPMGRGFVSKVTPTEDRSEVLVTFESGQQVDWFADSKVVVYRYEEKPE